MARSDYIESLIPELTPYEIFDFYDGPKFYSCEDRLGQLFIVYWVEENEDSNSWLYLRISQDRYRALKNGAIPIAASLADPEEGFSYLVKTYGDHYSVTELTKSEIAFEWLPDASDVLCIPTATLPEKSKSAHQLSESINRQVLDLAFEKLNHSFEFGCGKLGKLLDAIQNALYALASDQHTNIRRVSEETKVNSEFFVTGVFASSFGVRLQPRSNYFMPEDDSMRAAEALSNLLTDSAVPEVLAEQLKTFNVLTRSRFKHLVKVLVDSEVSLKTDWGSPSGKSVTSRTSFNELLQTLNLLEHTDEAVSQKSERQGKLVGVDVESDFFAIMLDDKEVIKGKLAKNLAGRHFDVPSRIVANLQETCLIDPLTEKEKWSYVLLDFIQAT